MSFEKCFWVVPDILRHHIFYVFREFSGGAVVEFTIEVLGDRVVGWTRLTQSEKDYFNRYIFIKPYSEEE